MSERPHLRELARICGILPRYERADGQIRFTSDETYEALLTAMGLDASSERSAEQSAGSLRSSKDSRCLDPVRVMRSGTTPAEVTVNASNEFTGKVEWQLVVTLEDGSTLVQHGESRFHDGALTLGLPGWQELVPGYHHLVWRGHGAGLTGPGTLEAEQTLIVVPRTCLRADEVIGEGRVYGIAANLYTIRSDDNLGIGDLGDLATLARWAGGHNADFVGINPLHAIDTGVAGASPYSPVSRVWGNPIYIDVEAVPELGECGEARALLSSVDFRELRARLRADDDIDYPAITDLKRRLLKPLHRAFSKFHANGRTQRGRDYGAFVEHGGEDLDNFATFMALGDHLAPGTPGSRDWRKWPAGFRTPSTAEVAGFRAAHTQDVDFYRYLQFEFDRQLGATSERTYTSGLRLGIYQDLAVGTTPGGSDTWAFMDLFARGATLGAPPDAFAVDGQDWQLAPVIPQRLRNRRYGYWISMLRNACRHAGMLRLDHAMGVVRQFWVPEGSPGSQGAYVAYPAEDLFGILALESRRSSTVVVAEDLGTVPEGFRGELAEWGALRSLVLYFERDGGDGFRAASQYDPQALASANTHDLAPLASFWAGRDLQRRREIGLIADDALEAAERVREFERTALTARLRLEGVCGEHDEPTRYPELCAMVSSFLARTPAKLVAVALDDLAGEQLPVNIPSSCPPQQLNWSRKMSKSLEQLQNDMDVVRSLGETPSRKQV